MACMARRAPATNALAAPHCSSFPLLLLGAVISLLDPKSSIAGPFQEHAGAVGQPACPPGHRCPCIPKGRGLGGPFQSKCWRGQPVGLQVGLSVWVAHLPHAGVTPAWHIGASSCVQVTPCRLGWGFYAQTTSLLPSQSMDCILYVNGAGLPDASYTLAQWPMCSCRFRGDGGVVDGDGGRAEVVAVGPRLPLRCGCHCHNGFPGPFFRPCTISCASMTTAQTHPFLAFVS